MIENLLLDREGAARLIDEKTTAIVGDLAAQADGQGSLIEVLRANDLLPLLSPPEVGGGGASLGGELEFIRRLTRLCPQLGWTFMILAGTTARIAAVCPPRERQRLFPCGSSFPSISMYDDPRACRVTRDASDGRYRFEGSWRCATGVADADWVVLLGQSEGSLREELGDVVLAHAVRPSQIAINPSAVSPMGLARTRTFAYSALINATPDEVFLYDHTKPSCQGPWFKVRRSPVKHLGFALGLLEGCLDGERETPLRSTSEKEAWATRDIGYRSISALAIREVQSLDDQLFGGSIPRAQELDRIQGIARYATVFVKDLAVELLLQKGSTLNPACPRRHRAEIALTALQHFAVRPRAYHLYADSLSSKAI